jgi:hypothetical protein
MKKGLQIVFTKSDKIISKVTGLFLCAILSLNLSGQKIYTILGETWTSGNWQNSSYQTNTYDVSGYLTNSLTQSWDVPSLAWLNVSLNNFVNNPDGTANQSVFQMWDGVSAWNDFSRSTYTYNTSKQVLTQVGETWIIASWVTSSRTTNTYDGSGYKTLSLNESWNGASWVNSSQTIYTNNPDGTVNYWINQTYAGSSWNDFQRLTYTYSSGKVQTEVADEWTSGNWLPKTKISYTYDGDGFVTNILSQLWDVGSSTWKDNSQDIYTNNPDGTAQQVVSQTWDGVSAWNNTDRLTFTYSQPTGVTELSDDENFTLYPNPAYDFITVKADKEISGSTYSFTDQAGKQVLSGKLNDDITTINITSLVRGIYFLRIGKRSQDIYKVIKLELK